MYRFLSKFDSQNLYNCKFYVFLAWGSAKVSPSLKSTKHYWHSSRTAWSSEFKFWPRIQYSKRFFWCKMRSVSQRQQRNYTIKLQNSPKLAKNVFLIYESQFIWVFKPPLSLFQLNVYLGQVLWLWKDLNGLSRSEWHQYNQNTFEK